MNLSTLKRHPYRPLHRLVNALYHDPETVVLRKDAVDYVVANGAKFYLTDCVQDIQLAQPDWLRNVRPTDICLDLGAGIGSVAIPLAMKAATVYAVEPLFHAELKPNAWLNNLINIEVVDMALGPSDGHAETTFGGRSAWTETRPFKDFCQWAGRHIDWLKVDVEGAEWDHLKPQDCEGIREVRIEFHIRRRYRLRDEFAIDAWRRWFNQFNYDLIEERGIPLPWGQPFAYCYSMNASRSGA